MDAVKRAAEEYNNIGEQAARAGIQQFLHDENFEVSKVDGRLTYEVLLELLDPKLVKMQFQMSAMREVGDPVAYFTKYPGRFLSMHLQGVAGDTTVAVGQDGLDWAHIFGAAKTGGVKNYFVEMSWDLTVPSVAYLKTLR
jgi:sugar phosphate isomerase/epimerase